MSSRRPACRARTPATSTSPAGAQSVEHGERVVPLRHCVWSLLGTAKMCAQAPLRAAAQHGDFRPGGLAVSAFRRELRRNPGCWSIVESGAHGTGSLDSRPEGRDSATARREAKMPKPTIVLVHGAWADGSSWNAVASELQRQDFTVLAPPNLLRGVNADAPYIASFLAQRTSGPVVLVGHSYGGFVITNAATGGGDGTSAGLRRRVRPRRGRDRLPDPGRLRVGAGRARPDHGPRPRRLSGGPRATWRPS